MIDFIDDFLPYSEYEYVVNHCLNSPYYYGEKDYKDTRPVGMISRIEKNDSIFKIFDKEIGDKVKKVKNLSIQRMYINCFAPEEKTFFHRDGKHGITCLFYANTDYEINSGGETQLIVDNLGINILPIPNRLAFFDANILHKATSFTNKHRFTIVVKYV